MIYKFAEDLNFNDLLKKESHISKDILKNKIEKNEIIVAIVENEIVGYLRFNYFWDEIPFMNMLFIDEDFRNKGIGSELVGFWENEMKKRDFTSFMTSSLSNERAQDFYKKLNYKDCGSLLLEDALEIIFIKKISSIL